MCILCIQVPSNLSPSANYKFISKYIISMISDSTLDPESQFPFEDIPPNEQFYFNKFTEEANLFSQKNQIKSMETENV